MARDTDDVWMWKLENKEKEWKENRSFWNEWTQKNTTSVVDSKEENEWVLNKADVFREDC